MARVFIDGFEDGTKNLWVGAGGAALPAAGGWGGQYYLSVQNTDTGTLYCEFKPSSTCFISMRLFKTGVWTATKEIFRLYSDATHIISLYVNASGYFSVKTAAGVVLGTSTQSYTFGNWDHYQLKYVAGTGNGIIEFKFNGVTQFTIDTATIPSSVNRLRFYCDNAYGPYADDIVIDDADWPGSTRIMGLLPNSPGSSTGFTPAIPVIAGIAASYWRFTITNNVANNVPSGNLYINEIQMFTDDSPTVSVCVGGTASSDAGTASNAFDGSPSSNWGLNPMGTTRWIKYAFATPQNITKYSFKGWTDPAQSPSAWVLEYSTNNTDWVVAHTVTNQSTWANSEVKTYGPNYASVIDYPQSDITYVSTNNEGTTDLYGMADYAPPNTGVTWKIKCIQPSARIQYEGVATTTKLALAVKPAGGAVSLSATDDATTIWSSVRNIWEFNPATGTAWDSTTVNSLECGFIAKV